MNKTSGGFLKRTWLLMNNPDQQVLAPAPPWPVMYLLLGQQPYWFIPIPFKSLSLTMNLLGSESAGDGNAARMQIRPFSFRHKCHIP